MTSCKDCPLNMYVEENDDTMGRNECAIGSDIGANDDRGYWHEWSKNCPLEKLTLKDGTSFTPRQVTLPEYLGIEE